MIEIWCKLGALLGVGHDYIHKMIGFRGNLLISDFQIRYENTWKSGYKL